MTKHALPRKILATTATGLLLLGFLACVTESDLPPFEREPLTQSPGRLLATGVPRFSQPMISPYWVWLDSGQEAAYATSTGVTGEGALWRMDVNSGVAVRLLDLDVPQAVVYSASQNRIYVGQWRALVSIAADGSDPVLETTDIQAHVFISPDGRYRAYNAETTVGWIIIDTQEADTLQLGNIPRTWRLEDSGHLIHLLNEGTGVGVLDLSSGDVTAILGRPDGGVFDIRGPASAPELALGKTDSEGDLRVMIFVGDAAGPGTVTEVHRISGDSIWGSPGNNVVASRSPDGDLFGFGVTRSITCGGGCTERYAIEVYDRSSGVNRMVILHLTQSRGPARMGGYGLETFAATVPHCGLRVVRRPVLNLCAGDSGA